MQLSGHIQPAGTTVSPAIVNEALTNLDPVAAPAVSVPTAANKSVIPKAEKLPEETPRTLKLKQISEGKNPRTYFDLAEMAALVASIVEHGVAQPILVRWKNGRYEIIAGHRRYRAALEAHGEDYDMPVSIRECTDAEAEVLANIENTIRADMSPIEEAVSAASVVGRAKGDRDEACRELSWSRSKLDSRLALMNCADVVRTALNERQILIGHAELFASLAKASQEKLLPAILEKKTSVVELKAVIEQASSKLESAIFEKVDCDGCAHNSTVQASMFEQSITDGTLVITGERAEESSNRAKYKAFEPHRTDLRNGLKIWRHVDHWRPVHAWTEAEVWEIIRKHRVAAHPAYHLGWGRTSCRTCIFGNADQWATIRTHMPDAFEPIARYERQFNVTIHRSRTVNEQADLGIPYPCTFEMLQIAESREYLGPIFLPEGSWVLPIGAFKDGCGPT